MGADEAFRWQAVIQLWWLWSLPVLGGLLLWAAWRRKLVLARLFSADRTGLHLWPSSGSSRELLW